MFTDIETDIEFTIIFYLDPIISVEGNNICITSSGKCILNDISIKKNGVYGIKAECDICINWENSYKIIVPIGYLKITINPVVIYIKPTLIKETFLLEVSVFTSSTLDTLDTTNYYNIQVSLSSGSDTKILESNTSNGIAQFFNQYFTTEGAYVINAYSISANYFKYGNIVIKCYYPKISLIDINVKII